MLAERLAQRGELTPEDVAPASRAGDAAANAIVQRAGALIGQMLASVVNFFNPSHVFIGGGVTRIGPLFLAPLRQSVYHRSLALSTRHLEIQYTPLGDRAGLIGAACWRCRKRLQAARKGRLHEHHVAVAFDNVVKSFGPVRGAARRQLRARARAASYGLLGENGAGKSHADEDPRRLRSA